MPYDLNKPAFGPDAEKVSVAAEPETSTEVEDEKDEEAPEAAEAAEEKGVKYARFKKFHDRALDAEARAAELEAELEQMRRTREVPARDDNDTEVPGYWKKLYGDETSDKWPLVQEAWRVTKQAQDELTEKARREAVEAVREAQYEEVARTNQNVEVLDENFEDLSALVGRDLSAKEQSAILDIVDEFTPKGEDGNYLGQIIPFEKAWEIYELKQQAAGAPKRASRDAVASLTGSSSQGEPSNKTEQDKNFNPLDWGAYRKRL